MKLERKAEAGKKVLIGLLLALGLLCFGSVNQVQAAPAPIIVQFRTAALSNPENGGAVVATFMFTNSSLQNVFHEKIKITYQITGTASPSDYVFNHQPNVINGIVEVPAGTGDYGVILGHVGDSVVEPDETVIIKIVSLSYAGLNPVTIGSQKTFTDTIFNDDVLQNLQFTVAAISSVENQPTLADFVWLDLKDSNGNNFSTNQEIDVSYQVVSASASPSDYYINSITPAPQTGTIHLTAYSQGRFYFPLTQVYDDLFEADENIKIKLTGITDADPNTDLRIGQRSMMTYTIVNDDFPNYVQFATPATTTPEAAPNFVYLKLTDAFGDNYAHQDIYLNYQITGTADSSDFNFNNSISLTDTLLIPAGNGPYILPLAILNDEIFENDENFTIKILSVSDNDPNTDLRIGPTDTFTYTIVNDDFPHTVEFVPPTSTTVSESMGGAFIQLKLADAYGNNYIHSNVHVHYQITGSATMGASDAENDLTFDGSTSNIGTMQIPAGNGGQYTFVLAAIDDNRFEGDETAVIKIIGVNADDFTVTEIGGNDTYTHTIVNDDFPHTVEFETPASAAVEGTNNAVVVKLADAYGNAYIHNAMHVHYQITGTATPSDTASPADNDFIFDNTRGYIGTMQIPAGSGNRYTFNLNSFDDALAETNETAVIKIIGVNEDSATFATDIGVQDTFTHTIIDNDIAPPISLNITATTTMSRIYAPNSTNVPLGIWKFAAQNGSIELSKVTLQSLYANGSGVASTLGTFGALSLWDGSTQLGGTANYVNGNVVFNAPHLVTIPQGSYKMLTLKGNINDSGIITNNVPIKFAIKSDSNADVEARTVSGQLLGTADINYNAFSNVGPAESQFAPSVVYVFHDAFPIISALSLGTGQLSIDAHAKIFKFNVRNAGTQDLRLSGATISVSSFGLSTLGNITDLRLYEDNGVGGLGTYLAQNNSVINSTTNLVPIAFNSSNDQSSLLDNLVVTPGATRTFIVTANTTNALTGLTSGNTVRVSGTINGASGWNGTVWNTGNLFYYYSPAATAEQGPFSASDSYYTGVIGPLLSYTL
jgi:hypothetical protein